MRELDKEEEIKLKGEILCAMGTALAKCGAETRLIINLTEQLARSFKLSHCELNINRSQMTVNISEDGERFYFSGKIPAFGINMSALTSLNRICLDIISGKITNLEQIKNTILTLQGKTYGKNKLIFIEAVAASAFAYLNGGVLKVALAAFLGGLVLMSVRFSLTKAGFFPVFTFMCAAFFGCSTTFIASEYLLDSQYEEIKLSVMATTLLLVPGYPLMNGFLDIFKGYLETGIFRLQHAAVLITAAATGLLGAMSLTTWLYNV